MCSMYQAEDWMDGTFGDSCVAGRREDRGVSHDLDEKSEVGGEEVPQDLRAFFGHPLMAASSASNINDTRACGLALLHEYQNLPTIDKDNMKGEEKYDSLLDMARHDTREQAVSLAASAELNMILQDAGVDAYLSHRDNSSTEMSNGDHKAEEKVNFNLGDLKDINITVKNDPDICLKDSVWNMNQRDTFLLGFGNKDEVPSPLASFIKGEPDASPSANDLGISSPLPYPTFDFQNFPDEQSLIEELDNSFNGHYSFQDSDEILSNSDLDINSQLLQALTNPVRNVDIKHIASHTPVSGDAGSPMDIPKDYNKSLHGSPSQESDIVTAANSSDKKKCAVHGPLSATTASPLNTSSSTPKLSHQAADTSHQTCDQIKPPPEYVLPPSMQCDPHTSMPPPYPFSNLGKTDTPVQKLMPIQYLIPPRTSACALSAPTDFPNFSYPCTISKTSASANVQTVAGLSSNGLTTTSGMVLPTMKLATVVTTTMTVLPSNVPSTAQSSMQHSAVPRPTSLPLTSVLTQKTSASQTTAAVSSPVHPNPTEVKKVAPGQPPAIPMNPEVLKQRYPRVVSIPAGCPIPPGAHVIFPPNLRTPLPVPPMAAPISTATANNTTTKQSVPQSPIGQPPKSQNLLLYPPYAPGLMPNYLHPQYALVRPPISTPQAFIPQSPQGVPNTISVNNHASPTTTGQSSAVKSNVSSAVLPNIQTPLNTQVTSSVTLPKSGVTIPSPLMTYRMPNMNPVVANGTSHLQSPVTSAPNPQHKAHGHHCAVHGYVPAKSRPATTTVASATSLPANSVPVSSSCKPVVVSASHSPATVQFIKQENVPGSVAGTSVMNTNVLPVKQLQSPKPPEIPMPALIPIPASPGAMLSPRYMVPMCVPQSAAAVQQSPGLPVGSFANGISPNPYMLPLPPNVRPPLLPGASYIPLPTSAIDGKTVVQQVTDIPKPVVLSAPQQPGLSASIAPLNVVCTSGGNQMMSPSSSRPASTPAQYNSVMMYNGTHVITTGSHTHCLSAPTTPSNPKTFVGGVHGPLGLSHSRTVQNVMLKSPSVAEQASEISDAEHKASDSTRRIINALNAKMENNQVQKPLSNTDINDIINQSMCAAGITPDSNGCLPEEPPLGVVSSQPLTGSIVTTNTTVAVDTKTGLKPKQLFIPQTCTTTDTKPLSKPIEQSWPPNRIALTHVVSPMQVVHPNTAAAKDVPPPLIKLNPIRHPMHLTTPPGHRIMSTTTIHKPSAIVHPAASPIIQTIKKEDVSSAAAVVPVAPQTPISTTSCTPVPQNADLRSPDSGFNETCVSPSEAQGYEDSQPSSPSGDGSGDRLGKRRRSSSSQKSMCSNSSLPGKVHPQGPVVPKLESEVCCFDYCLETNTSTSQRIEEDRITYLNKGQFYGLRLEHVPRKAATSPTSNTLRSVIMVVFRDERCVADELRAWEFWHTRQHSFKQRIIDIDTKNCTGVLPNSIEEVSHNAVSITWNPVEQAKVSIAIHCLSTDFSNQKGVKGVPLHIQIDTYEDSETKPIHRGYCQVKVFCDKGAERKARDEERRKEAKSKLAETNAGRRRVEETFHPHYEQSMFYHMSDLDKKPILFNAAADGEEFAAKRLPISPVDAPAVFHGGHLGDVTDMIMSSPAKRMRTLSYTSDTPKVLLYVREAHESAFTALVLHSPTVKSLMNAIEGKYNVDATHIEHIFKRSKKGILVKMDDNILTHYSNESTFIIELQREKIKGIDEVVKVTLTEIESNTD